MGISLDDLRQINRAGILAALVCAAAFVVLYSQKPWIIALLLFWAFAEGFTYLIRKGVLRRRFQAARRLFHREKSPFVSLEIYLQDWTPSAVLLLDEQIAVLRNNSALSREERQELERLWNIVELRKLLTLPQTLPKRKLRQLFVLNAECRKNDDLFFESLDPQSIIESATLVANLYQKVGEAAENNLSFYRFAAQKVLETSLQEPYSQSLLHHRVESIIDQIQQHSGISFLILNLIKKNNLASARVFAQRLLKEEWEIDEDLCSALYWLTELLWFSREYQRESGVPISDYETSMRYLYHICFTAPERAHFLEIDSQYFSQFETVNELAREAFLFKENLVERLLDLWGSGEGFFDASYKEVLESMTQLKSKIYEDHLSWTRTWNREAPTFSKSYLFVVEGNLFYATGQYSEAKAYYEKALKEDPSLRSALLNSVFAYAKLGEKELHGWMVDRILNLSQLFPSHLYVAGNSYLLMGQDKKAEEFYTELAEVPGWAQKADFYRSTFCFENKIYEKALLYARLAEKANPNDPSVLYHLSLCYNAVGEKDRALEVIKRLEDRSHWLDYYRFTLERDAGREEDAIQTLLTMPSQYFEDPEELEQALTFAKAKKDLRLLRHLKNRS